MDPDTEAELLALRAELNAVRRNQSLPGAIAVIALLLAAGAMLFSSGCP